MLYPDQHCGFESLDTRIYYNQKIVPIVFRHTSWCAYSRTAVCSGLCLLGRVQRIRLAYCPAMNEGKPI